jgi:aromatic-L-amino-acid decarboxylase
MHDLPLEPNAAEMRRLIDTAAERVIAHVDSLPRQPAGDTAGAMEAARLVAEPLPEQGMDFDALLDLLFDRLVPPSFNTAGPGYLAYIPGGGLYHTAVADYIADAVNRYTGVTAAAPALVALEVSVIRWLCDAAGYPQGAGGILTTGGSLANFTAIVAARRSLLGDDFMRGTIYTSDQVHHSIAKAATLAGFPAKNVREIGSDERFCLRSNELEQAIASDRAAGFQPLAIVGSAGTTNTGAIDELETLAAIAQREKMWFHVDAAYGGGFLLTERGRAAMRGIEQADSITLDPHKALFLPYGTGCLLVRDREILRRAHSLHAAYLPAMQEEGDLIDFCELSPELSRAFRGLRLWLPLKHLGAAAFRESLDEKLDLTQWATEQLKTIDGIDIVAEPQLSIVAFRFVRDGATTAELNALNQQLLARINAKQRVMLTHTILRSEFVIRICVVSFRTHRDRMEQCLEDIRDAVIWARGEMQSSA